MAEQKKVLMIKDFVDTLDVKAYEGGQKLKTLSVSDPEFHTVLQNTMDCINVSSNLQQQAAQAYARAMKEKAEMEQAKQNKQPPKEKVFDVVEGGKKED